MNDPRAAQRRISILAGAMRLFATPPVAATAVVLRPDADGHPPGPKPRAQISIADLDRRAAVVAKDDMVSSDPYEVVNTWNPRHLEDQLTVESVTVQPAGGRLF